MNSSWEDIEKEGLVVVGAGSWGTALACHLGRKGVDVDLWVYEQEVLEQILEKKENQTFLPGIPLPSKIRPFNDLEEAVGKHRIILLVVPSHFMRNVLERLKGIIPEGVVLASAAKGVENETLMTMSQVFEDVLGSGKNFHSACLSGPSFAREVGNSLPTAVTAASGSTGAAELLQKMFSSGSMRVYTSQDIIGVELGGALKNVFAIGAGIGDGLGLGTNARAALITRGLAEMTRLGVQMGANPLTFMGLAGIGDLVLTCTGDLSRNRTVGLKLGGGIKLKDILGEMNMVAEGVKTTRSIYGLARRENVEMPLTEQVYRILYEDRDPREALTELMNRDLKKEIDKQLG